MARAKQPVSVGGIEFDALIDESRTLEATVPEYAVEDGFSVSDAIIKSPETLTMTLFVTDTPVTWKNRHGTTPGRVEQICKRIEELYFKSEPVTVVTSDDTYTDMAIESITISKTAEVGYAREIPISFKKIRVTSSQTATIPASYGKSGETGVAVGTANTTQASTTSGGAVSNGSTVSNESESGTKSSILYGAAKSYGLIS